jgi:hypothetical protein
VEASGADAGMKFHGADSFFARGTLGLLHSAILLSKHDAVCASAAREAFPAEADERKTC